MTSLRFAKWFLAIPLADGTGDGASISGMRSTLLALITIEAKPTTFTSIAKISGLSERATYRAVQELELLGHIRRENTGFEKKDGGTVFRVLIGNP